MTFAASLKPVKLITAHMDVKDQADTSRKLLYNGYKKEVVKGSVRGEWSEEAKCMVFLYDVIYRDPTERLPSVKRTEYLASNYK